MIIPRPDRFLTSLHEQADALATVPFDVQSPCASAGAGVENAIGVSPQFVGLSDTDLENAIHTRKPGRTKTVLVLASRFPPVASVGAIRIRKFVKYLERFGWKPVVLTGARRRQKSGCQDVRRATDEESLQDLPLDLPVYRLSPNLDDWPSHLSGTVAEHLASVTAVLGYDASYWRRALKWRFQRQHDRFSFPDRGIWRLPWTVKKALDLHRHYRFDAIFSSGMPFSDHLIALVLRRLLRRPWLADFRDPWVDYIHWKQWQSRLGRRLTRTAEAAVVRNAAFIISVNKEMSERFASRYSREPAKKFVTITNGFDPRDFDSIDEDKEKSHFRLVYAGSLYGKRSPDKVLDAFRRFVQSTPGSADRVRFDFFGRPGPFLEQLKNPADQGRVRYCGMVSHSEALKAMMSADLNIVVLPKTPGSENDTTTKLYECLGSGRPILAAVPLTGAAARVLRPFKGVTLCDPDVVDDMVQAITEWYGRWLRGPVTIPRSSMALAPLTRFHQTRQLARCLHATAGVNRTTGRVGL